MKAHHYLGTGIKLFAIFLLLFSIQKLAFFVENIIHGTVQGMPATIIISGLIYIPWVVVAIVLWCFPLSIAKKIIPPEAELQSEGISATSLLSVFISAISLFFLYRAIMDSVYWATVLNLSESGIYATFSPENKASIFSTGVELVATAILFFNSRKISLWASKF